MKNLRLLLLFSIFFNIQNSFCQIRGEGLSNDTPLENRIVYLPDSKFLIDKSYLDDTFSESSEFRFLKFYFGEINGKYNLIICPVKANYISFGVDTNVVESTYKVIVEPNKLLRRANTRVVAVVAQENTQRNQLDQTLNDESTNSRLSTFSRSKFGSIKAYYIEKEALYKLISNNRIRIKIANQFISKKTSQLYLVFLDKNNQVIASTFYLPPPPPRPGVIPGVNGGSRPCPPFGCND